MPRRCVVRPAQTLSAEDQPFVYPLASAISFDRAPNWFLTAASVTWVETAGIARDDVVVILGQGLVGSLILQVARANRNGHLVAVDTLDFRCALAEVLLADVVVNASWQDPVQVIRRLTAGAGAFILIYAVGGPAGPAAFAQSLERCGATAPSSWWAATNKRAPPLSRQISAGSGS